MKKQWVLRCAITGEPFASQETVPDDVGMPVVWDWRECYWALETVQTVQEDCPVCLSVGGYCGGSGQGNCPPYWAKEGDPQVLCTYCGQFETSDVSNCGCCGQPM